MVLPNTTGIKNCWNQIGVGGDRSCSELKTVIHCRNCPTYADAGRGLLDREIPTDYFAADRSDQGSDYWAASVQSWAVNLGARPASSIVRSPTEVAPPVSVMIFRLAAEGFAVPVKMLQEVTPLSVVHTLPHRSNELLLGLVNIRGEILLCVSLKHLLDLQLAPAKPLSDKKASPSVQSPMSPKTAAKGRMIVITNSRDRWVFAVDEVCGFHRFHPAEMQPPPTVITACHHTYTAGVIDWQGQPVNCLDTDRLFHTLNRRIL